MKINSTIILELNKKDMDFLNEQYTMTVAKIVTSELSLQEIDELIENLMIK